MKCVVLSSKTRHNNVKNSITELKSSKISSLRRASPIFYAIKIVSAKIIGTITFDFTLFGASPKWVWKFLVKKSGKTVIFSSQKSGNLNSGFFGTKNPRFSRIIRNSDIAHKRYDGDTFIFGALLVRATEGEVFLKNRKFAQKGLRVL